MKDRSVWRFLELCLLGLASGSLACSGAEVETQEPTGGAAGSSGAGNLSSGGSNGSAMPPEDLGHRCPDVINLSGCSEGLECLEWSLIGSRICSKVCSAGFDADCPAGSACATAEQNDTPVCSPICASDDDCQSLAAAGFCRMRRRLPTLSLCSEK